MTQSEEPWRTLIGLGLGLALTLTLTVEDSDRESQANLIDVCKSLWCLSAIIIRFQQLHQST